MNAGDDEVTCAVEAGSAMVRAMISTVDHVLVDDNDLMAVIRHAIDGLAEHLDTLGANPERIGTARDEVWSVGRDRYLSIWMRQTYEIEEGPVDEEVERKEGLRAFELARRGRR